MKRMIVVLVVLLAATVTASAQTNESALAVDAPAKVPLPAEETGINTLSHALSDTLSHALSEAPTQTNVAAVALRLVPEPLLSAAINPACRPPSQLTLTCTVCCAPACCQRRQLGLPGPRWDNLQTPASSASANGHAGFRWESALKQSLLFLGVQHGYAMTQAKTRRELKGPFWRDYFRSVAGTGGWADGGRFFTNYISHPMQGAISGYIQVQNDPRGMSQEFSRARSYWTSRLKAMAWTAAYSTQFEIGPISQSSIGNVGLHTSLDGKKRKLAYVDLVVTPTLGTAWLVGEDVLDRYLVRWVERRNNRLLWRGTARVLFNPMRAAANLIRFKLPWYRDR